jgi:hypothetical protein
VLARSIALFSQTLTKGRPKKLETLQEDAAFVFVSGLHYELYFCAETRSTTTGCLLAASAVGHLPAGSGCPSLSTQPCSATSTGARTTPGAGTSALCPRIGLSLSLLILFVMAPLPEPVNAVCNAPLPFQNDGKFNFSFYVVGLTTTSERSQVRFPAVGYRLKTFGEGSQRFYSRVYSSFLSYILPFSEALAQ